MDDTDQAQSVELGEMQESSPSIEDEENSDRDPDRYCAVILAETVIVLSRALANVSLDDARIMPMRSGIESAYGRQLLMRRSAAQGQREALIYIGQFAFCMDFDANFHFGLKENDYGTSIRLLLILELFSGGRPYLSHKGVSDACSRGLCAYFRILKDVSFTKSDVGSIGIIPGRIQYEKKSYTSLKDRYATPDEEFDTSMVDLVRTGVDFSTLELSIRESSSALECLIQLPRLSGILKTVVAGPTHLADFISARRGLVHCNQRSGGGKSCQKIKGLTSDDRRRMMTEGGRFVKDWMNTGKGVWFFHCQDPLVARVALSHCAAQHIYKSPILLVDKECLKIFVVDKECLDCCLKAVTGIEIPDDVYFVYLAES
jgi:hypothetical protein